MEFFHFGMHIRSIALLFLAVFGGVSTVHSQQYRFSKYGVESGLPQQYVYSIAQDRDGFIWAGTGEGLARFDGVDFTNFNVTAGMAEDFVTAAVFDDQGRLFAGHNLGGISMIENGVTTIVRKDTFVTSSINAMAIDQNGLIWATSQEGKLLRINEELVVDIFDISANEFLLYSINVSPKGELMVGTSEGMYLYSLNDAMEPDAKIRVKQVEGVKISCIVRSKMNSSDYWVGSNVEGLFQMRFEDDGNYKLRNSNGDFQLKEHAIEDVFEDNEGNLWLATYNGLYKLIFETEFEGHRRVLIYNASNGLSDFIRKVYQDREGNIWIGTYGEGLCMLKDEFFSFYYPGGEEVSKDVRSLYFEGDTKWFGVGNGLLRFNPEEDPQYRFYTEEQGIPAVPVTALSKNKQKLWIGTDGEGLFVLDTETDEIAHIDYSEDRLSNSINGILSDDTRIYLATRGGVHKITETGQKLDRYSTITGLIHNNIYDIFRSSTGRLFVSSHGNLLTELTEGTIAYISISSEARLMDIYSMSEDNEHHLWVGTTGNGVFFQTDSGFQQITSADGLKSDYCYSLVHGVDDDIWVGHKEGLSRINPATGAIEIFDKKFGIHSDFNQNATFRDADDKLWFGTTNGVLSFDPSKFKTNEVPPALNLKNVYLKDQLIKLDGPLELDYGAYKLDIEFIGISFINQDDIEYQFYLEGYDLDWSLPTATNKAKYPRLEEGEYVFHAKACNSDGICSEEAVLLKVSIDNPFWKKWWFFVLVFAVVVGIVATYIKIRERRHKELQKYLEKQLELRQAEVIEKNELLEEKNTNITSSINYALRIQKSILPKKELLKKFFPESFIINKPRDIVSGDFYWYREVGDHFLVACADCTGHGVPGGFMSMISSTIFREITDRYNVTDPAEFLTRVNQNITESLSQDSTKASHDGLDMVLCSFVPGTGKVAFAGAMRPLVVVKDGKVEILRTSRHSIGGYEADEKKFENFTVDLNPGDSIYMFSDGLQDQFGGPRNRKFQLKKLIEILYEMHPKPAAEQKEIMEAEFQDWMGDNEQIDDILLIGLKMPENP